MEGFSALVKEVGGLSCACSEGGYGSICYEFVPVNIKSSWGHHDNRVNVKIAHEKSIRQRPKGGSISGERNYPVRIEGDSPRKCGCSIIIGKRW